ncbi:MAG: glycosyltransferase [Limisphaerales bacterium]
MIPPKRPLRIAFFNALEQASGAEQLTRETVEGLNARGHEARLYVQARTQSPRPYVYKIPYFRGEEATERWLRQRTGWNDYFFPSTWRMTRDPWIKSADIWHFHNLHGHFLSIPAISWHSRHRRIVLSPVDEFVTTGYCPYSLGCERYRTGCGTCPQIDLAYPGISRDATHRLWRMKRRAIAGGRFEFLVHTQYLSQHFHAALGIESNLRQLYYGVNLQVNKPMPRDKCAAERGLNVSNRLVVGLFHSNILEPRKGFLPLLQGLQEMAKRFPGKLEVLVVGRDSDKAKALETPDLPVQFLPFLRSEQELAQALNLCDVLLYPTRADNLSLTCLCSLACGVPVISSAVGGQVEAISDNQNGFLTPVGDNDAILNRIGLLLTTPGLIKQMSSNARQSAVEKFDISVYIDRLIQYYHSHVLVRT